MYFMVSDTLPTLPDDLYEEVGLVRAAMLYGIIHLFPGRWHVFVAVRSCVTIAGYQEGVEVEIVPAGYNHRLRHLRVVYITIAESTVYVGGTISAKIPLIAYTDQWLESVIDAAN